MVGCKHPNHVNHRMWNQTSIYHWKGIEICYLCLELAENNAKMIENILKQRANRYCWDPTKIYQLYLQKVEG